MSSDGAITSTLDVKRYPSAQKLITRCQDFLKEIQDLTPGADLECHLNATYGSGTPYFVDFYQLVQQGLGEGWVASTPVDGSRYRRGKLALPSPENQFFSITTVYMDSRGQDTYSGQHHGHPYGEINCVIQIDETAELEGMQGWQGAGWTSPGPGTHHVPRVRGGALVALFFMPAGRIAYDMALDKPQPACL